MKTHKFYKDETRATRVMASTSSPTVWSYLGKITRRSFPLNGRRGCLEGLGPSESRSKNLRSIVQHGVEQNYTKLAPSTAQLSNFGQIWATPMQKVLRRNRHRRLAAK